MASFRSAALLTLSLVLGSRVALADSLPPGALECERSTAGAACTVLAAPGKCETQTCRSPGVPDGDGGFTPSTERPCLVCVATSSSGSSGAASSSGSVDGGTSLSAPGEGGGGCNTGSSRTRTLDFALLATLGVIVAFAVRRRR